MIVLTLPGQFSVAVDVLLRYALAAVLTGDFLHLFNRAFLRPGTGRAPAPLLNAVWRGLPLVAGSTLPSQLGVTIDILRR